MLNGNKNNFTAKYFSLISLKCFLFLIILKLVEEFINIGSIIRVS
jgi:hypothetical protein